MPITWSSLQKIFQADFENSGFSSHAGLLFT